MISAAVGAVIALALLVGAVAYWHTPAATVANEPGETVGQVSGQ
jgi:hypothetical protein